MAHRNTLWQTNITMENQHFLMGKSTISMAIFNSFLYVYQRVDGWPMNSMVDLSMAIPRWSPVSRSMMTLSGGKSMASKKDTTWPSWVAPGLRIHRGFTGRWPETAAGYGSTNDVWRKGCVENLLGHWIITGLYICFKDKRPWIVEDLIR